MNLQVTVPYQKCVYNCPMCVAKGKIHNYNFANLYVTDKREWQKRFENILKAGNYDSVVLTGECDPTQDMRYCDDVISIVRNMRGKAPTIEFTTHNQKFDNALISVPNGHKVDVVTLSVTNSREYLNAWRVPQKNAFFTPIYRMVILLTDEFDFLNASNFNTMGFDQITFKTLQHGEDPAINSWIDANKMDETSLDNIRGIVEKFNSNDTCSVRLDTSCQTATGRYHIFRSDGKLYDSWEAIYSMEDYQKLKADLAASGDLEVVKDIIHDCAEEENEEDFDVFLGGLVDNMTAVINTVRDKVKKVELSYPPERFVYKDIPAPIIKEAEEKDYD